MLGDVVEGGVVLDAGDVAEGVEAPEPGGRLVDGSEDVTASGDVEVLVGGGPRAGRGRVPATCLAGVVEHVQRHDRGPLGDEGPHGGVPDATSAARDDDRLPLDAGCQVVPLVVVLVGDTRAMR
ncbi:MAG TPA: hypothetical protein VFV32_08400 [Acidimicrobiales bacterium]|nr:hypothetical protein [Acidimicrobiales bacterium]